MADRSDEKGRIVVVLRNHWPDPVFGCECGEVDEETGIKASVPSWEEHVADLLIPPEQTACPEVLADRDGNCTACGKPVLPPGTRRSDG